MIQLKMSGRAGNQFFQYLFVKEYMDLNKINEPLYISLEHLDKNKTDDSSFKSELDYYNIGAIQYIRKIKMTKKQLVLDFGFKVFNKLIRYNASFHHRKIDVDDYSILIRLLQKNMNKNGLYYYIPGMDSFTPAECEDIIFYGCYDDYSYYKNSVNHARELYTPKESVLPHNIDLLDKIQGSNSVCVTIRRGDYLNKKFKNNYYICDELYFAKAIELIKSKVVDPVFIFFSDDIEWCKGQSFIPENSYFECGNDPIWEKMRLMSSCKHFIISNSSFSWWAQFLSCSSEKIVVAPKVWNNFEYARGLYIDTWETV